MVVPAQKRSHLGARKGGPRRFALAYDSVERENKKKGALEHQFVTTS